MQGNEPSVCVLDYGSGNVRSVRNLFESMATDVQVSNEPDVIRRATHLVLPGVGAFGAAMAKISVRLPCDLLEQQVLADGKPFLGICVGMQVLGTSSTEFDGSAGLGWIPGVARQLDAGPLSLPHTGWNDLTCRRSSPLLTGLEEATDVYFAHSFVLVPDDPSVVLATAGHGEEFAAIVQRANVIGVQFHPEKSQHAGQVLMRNFLELG